MNLQENLQTTDLGWIWALQKTEFDCFWPSFKEDDLLCWPSLTFWLGLNFDAVDCRLDRVVLTLIWQVNFDICIISLCWTFDIIIRRIDQRAFPILEFFPSIRQIYFEESRAIRCSVILCYLITIVNNFYNYLSLIFFLLLVCMFHQTATKSIKTRTQMLALCEGKNLSLLERKTL